MNPVVRRDGLQRAQKVIVLCVRADPEPDDDIVVQNAECAVPKSDPCGVDGAGRVDAFEAQTSGLGVLFETAVGFTGPALNMIG